MPGVSRIGIGLQSKDGHVIVHNVLPNGAAAMLVAKGDVVFAVNGTLVHEDAALAQRLIVNASTQSTDSGRVLPVRVTLGSINIPSPTGVEADFMLDFSRLDNKRNSAEFGVNEVLQSL